MDAPLPEKDHPGSPREYVARMSESHRKTATMRSHHDSRTSRAKRGDSEPSRVATFVARRRNGASFLLKNMDLQHRLHVANYTPRCAGHRYRCAGPAPGWRTWP